MKGERWVAEISKWLRAGEELGTELTIKEAAILLRRQHAEFVRLVKKQDKTLGSGYHQACADILAALAKEKGK